MSKLETNTIDTVSGTTNLTIGSTNSSTVTFENGAPTGHMYPAFEAYLSSDQTVSSGTQTKIQFNTEDLDTDSAYDNSTNYRFTPNKAGKYFVYVTCNVDVSAGFYYASSEVLKNGSTIPSARILNIWENLSSSDDSIEGIFLTYHGIVDMNGSSDYVELYGRNLNSTLFKGDSDRRSYFGAYRIGA